MSPVHGRPLVCEMSDENKATKAVFATPLFSLLAGLVTRKTGVIPLTRFALMLPPPVGGARFLERRGLSKEASATKLCRFG